MKWRREETEQERAERTRAVDKCNAEAKDFLIGKGVIKRDYPDLQEEFAALEVASSEAEHTALCLSGGGIRSATFALGVLQALAKADWLRNFTYLSTVSGGGYIGSWLSSWIRRSGFEEVNAALANGKDGIEAGEIQRLRANSSYLSPVRGLSGDALALISTFIRNLLINWAILVPLLIAGTVLPLMNVAAYSAMSGVCKPGLSTLQIAFLALFTLCSVAALAYSMSDLPDGNAHQTRSNFFPRYVGLPIFVGAYSLSLGLVPMISACDPPPSWFLFGLAGAAIHYFGIGLGRVWFREKRDCFTPLKEKAVPADMAPWLGQWRIPMWLRVLWTAGLTGFVAGIAVYAGVELARAGFAEVVKNPRFWPTWHAILATLAVPFLLVTFFVGCTLYVALIRRTTDEGAREWWGRSGGAWIAISLAWIGAHCACVWIPAAISYAGASIGTTGGVGAIAGVFVAVAGYYSKQTANPREKESTGFLEKLNVSILELVALAFLLALFATTALAIVDWTAVLNPKAVLGGRDELLANYFGEMDKGPWRWGLVAAVGFATALLTSWYAGVNAFSMHALYANRLVRAFLGATRPPAPPGKDQDPARRPHRFTGFDPDDDFAMADMGNAAPRPLFHVINVALNIMKPSGERLEWQERKAASFTITALRTGSGPTGYCRTRDIGGRGGVPLSEAARASEEGSAACRGISIGRAMAISGAAASPNMGYHSSTLVAIVMTIFNVRLGWWMTNPARHEKDLAELKKEPPTNAGRWDRIIASMCSTEPRFPFRWLMTEMFGATKADAASVYLSDGGHFDNLGLYEMIRRGCKSIVLVDAGCDPKDEFQDLERAIRLIRNDLMVNVSFPHGLPTAAFIRETGQHYVFGEIHYPDGKRGSILYIKPGLDGDEPVDVTRYATRRRALNDPFPHQSTADQFFDESQFESYRALGYYSLWGSLSPDGVAPREADDTTNRVAEFLAKFPACAKVAAAKAAEAAAKDPEKTASGSGFLGTLSNLLSWDKLPGLLALLGIGVGADLVAGKQEEDPEADARTLITFPQASVPDDLDKVRDWTLLSEQGATLMLPLFAEGKICEESDLKCDPGDRLDGGSRSLLKVLDEKLVECGRDQSLPLKFSVRGMASTSEYKDQKTKQPLPNSDERNLKLADDRATVVYNHLPDSRDLNKGNKQPEFWLAPGVIADAALIRQQIAVMRDTLYVDRGTREGASDQAPADYSRGAGSMNRRVDIEFESLGTCKLLALQRALQNSFPSVSFRPQLADTKAPKTE